MATMPISIRTILGVLAIATTLSLALFLDLPAVWHVSRSEMSSWDGQGAVFVIQNTVPKKVGPGLPLRLRIPKIDIDSTIEYVGLAPDGAMDVPKDRNNAAWFELGPRPGETGSAVITGHYGLENRKRSVFDDLHKLRLGDRVSIEDAEGGTISFAVSRIQRYDPKADTSSIFVSSDGKPHLNLITCEGVWNTAIGGYPKRLVVFTDVVE